MIKASDYPPRHIRYVDVIADYIRAKQSDLPPGQDRCNRRGNQALSYEWLLSFAKSVAGADNDYRQSLR